MTVLPACGNYFPSAFAIVPGIIDATATLSPLLWAMVILLLLCAVGIAADRGLPRRGNGAHVRLSIVHRRHIVISELGSRAA